MKKRREPRFLPYVFTEHGALMAANVLNSTQAVKMSVLVVRAFVQSRPFLNPLNGLNGAPVLSEVEQSRRKAVERLELLERASVLF